MYNFKNKNTEVTEFTEEGEKTDKNSVFSVSSVFKNLQKLLNRWFTPERCEAALT